LALWTPFRAGERLTAGRLNALVTEWEPYTPVWSADTGTTTLGNGTLRGKYQRIGNTINFRIFLEWGTTTAQSEPAANWAFSLPATVQSSEGPEFWPVSMWVIHNTGSSNYRFTGAGYVDSSRNAVYALTTNADNAFLDSATFPSQVADSGISPDGTAVTAGDQVNIWGSYEAID